MRMSANLGLEFSLLLDKFEVVGVLLLNGTVPEDAATEAGSDGATSHSRGDFPKPRMGGFPL